MNKFYKIIKICAIEKNFITIQAKYLDAEQDLLLKIVKFSNMCELELFNKEIS